MSNLIPYGRQNINQKDINAVIQVLQSDWLTQGPAIERFEQSVANYCGVNYAEAVSSATYYGLTESEQDRVIMVLREVLSDN